MFKCFQVEINLNGKNQTIQDPRMTHLQDLITSLKAAIFSHCAIRLYALDHDGGLEQTRKKEKKEKKYNLLTGVDFSDILKV